jgi:hypothetical protein
VLFIGDDWAEVHHDVEIEDEAGRVLARRRLPEGLAGITMLHELVAEHLDPAAEPDQVLVGIETERGPWVQALLAAGYVVFAINRCRWPGIGNAIPRPGRSRMPRMRICWPRSSGWIGRITAGSLAIARSPNMSRSQLGRIRA